VWDGSEEKRRHWKLIENGERIPWPRHQDQLFVGRDTLARESNLIAVEVRAMALESRELENA